MARKDRRRPQREKSDASEAVLPPKLWLNTMGFAPPRPMPRVPERSVVVLWNSSEGQLPPPLLFAAAAQQLFVREDTEDEAILVVDLAPVLSSPEAALEAELGQGAGTLGKTFGKVFARTLQKLHMRSATIVSFGMMGQLLLKYLTTTDPRGYLAGESAAVRRAVLVHPSISALCVNKVLRNVKSSVVLDILWKSDADQVKREQIVRAVFSRGSSRVAASPVSFSSTAKLGEKDPRTSSGAPIPETSVNSSLLLAALLPPASCSAPLVPPAEFDPELTDVTGQSLFFSEMQLKMDRLTKQPVQFLTDRTEEMVCAWRSPQASSSTEGTELGASAADAEDGVYNAQMDEIGAVVLRGCRCVLVSAREGESPASAAVRAVSEMCAVEGETEVRGLPSLPTLSLYHGSAGEGRSVEVHVLYAVNPPPADGPLEDADLSDDEDCYDWYTFARAATRVGPRTLALLRTLAFMLDGAAMAGHIPSKWGGVFGQEFVRATLELPSSPKPTTQYEHAAQSSPVMPPPPPKPEGREDPLCGLKDAVAKVSAKGATFDPIPVTVLSGFLGAGKTTLLQHVLQNKQGLRVALIVNDMGSVNVDALTIGKLVRSEERMVELSNGCICCTLREDLFNEIGALAIDGRFDYIVIESSGISEPLPVAETFTFEDDNGTSLRSLARLDTLVTVVDGYSFLSELDTVEDLRTRGWQANVGDERSVSQLLCDQIDFANVIVLNKCDLISAEERLRLRAILSRFNPDARIIESVHSVVDPSEILDTKLFDFNNAAKHPEWLQESRIGEHTPETEEFGISSFTFRAKRPFHPARLYAAGELMAGRQGALSSLLRGKGIVWLATEEGHLFQGVAALAGKRFTVTPGSPWWASVDKADWPPGLKEAIKPLWHEPHGDRQVEFVVIGQDMDHAKVRAALEEALLTDDELSIAKGGWSETFENPFGQEWRELLDTANEDEALHNHHEHE